MKSLKFFKIMLVLSLALNFSACKKENSCDCFKRTGKIEMLTREVSGFDKIVAENNVNVFITQDSVFEVKIESGDNLIPLIKTEVVDGTLFISNKNRCNWTRSYKKPFNVYIKMPIIKYITSDGSGDIKSIGTITSNAFDIQTKSSGNIELTVNNSKVISHMNGSGDVTLHGVTYEHSCSIGGSAFLYCNDLQTSYTWIQSYTTGLCYVTAADLLICRIDEVGDVYCSEHPIAVQKIKNGKGNLYVN
jgi:hypothetical protein